MSIHRDETVPIYAEDPDAAIRRCRLTLRVIPVEILMNPEKFLICMIAAVPELAPVVREHIADNRDVLPHVLMGDITRWVTDQADDEARKRFFEELENGLASGTEAVSELINVSFLENLDVTDGEPALFGFFGRRLRAEWRQNHT